MGTTLLQSATPNSLAGTLNSGFYKRDCASEGEANEFVRDLQGKPVAIHYNVGKPSSSALLESDLESVFAEPCSGSRFLRGKLDS